jgi:hypothetical protein
MIEHGRAVTRQMLAVLDPIAAWRCRAAGEPSLALDQRQVAQVVNPTWDYGLKD